MIVFTASRRWRNDPACESGTVTNCPGKMAQSLYRVANHSDTRENIFTAKLIACRCSRPPPSLLPRNSIMRTESLSNARPVKKSDASAFRFQRNSRTHRYRRVHRHHREGCINEGGFPSNPLASHSPEARRRHAEELQESRG